MDMKDEYYQKANSTLAQAKAHGIDFEFDTKTMTLRQVVPREVKEAINEHKELIAKVLIFRLAHDHVARKCRDLGPQAAFDSGMQAFEKYCKEEVVGVKGFDENSPEEFYEIMGQGYLTAIKAAEKAKREELKARKEAKEALDMQEKLEKEEKEEPGRVVELFPDVSGAMGI